MEGKLYKQIKPNQRNGGAVFPARRGPAALSQLQLPACTAAPPAPGGGADRRQPIAPRQEQSAPRVAEGCGRARANRVVGWWGVPGSERALAGGACAAGPAAASSRLLPPSPAALRRPCRPRGRWRRGAELLRRGRLLRRRLEGKRQGDHSTESCSNDLVLGTQKWNLETLVFCMHGAEKMNSTMSEEPDALSVVNQLRDLAADPLNRRAIVQDQGCLPGLILFLDHPNPPVVHSALLALRYLAECRVNREKMKSELGMMLSLQNVIQKTTTPGETKLLASEVYDILQSSNMSDMDNVNEMNYRRRKAQFFLGSTNKRAKTVVLHIDGLDDSSRRNLCEEALLKIKGVISFTFQMAVQRCVVRIRSDLKAEALATAIASTKVMKAQQVVKSESGEEMLVPFQDTPVEVEQNTDLPEYLPEDESPTKEQDKAVSRVGSHPEGAASWLSTAANFLSRSFYW
ncbi:armadillo repeat-containing protein 1 isoform X2 [Strix aluco]|uniref:armadillo repeat-containing protein 1 isoform X2 n=1 Tax=Strix aluco TaxID=111821 RepID=UPI003DA2FBE0